MRAMLWHQNTANASIIYTTSAGPLTNTHGHFFRKFATVPATVTTTYRCVPRRSSSATTRQRWFCLHSAAHPFVVRSPNTASPPVQCVESATQSARCSRV